MLSLLSRNYYRREVELPYPTFVCHWCMTIAHPSIVRIQLLLTYSMRRLLFRVNLYSCEALIMVEQRVGGSFPGQLIYEFIMRHAQRQVAMVVVRGEDPKV
jgi:hypothetical protein